MTHVLTDTAVLTGRSLRHITRSLDTIITTAITPIAMMLMFVYVFGGAIRTGTDNYVNYLLPGILLITIASGIAYTAFRLFTDASSGIFERFHSMPIARSSVLWAHVLTSLVANLVSLVVVVGVALLMGFRSGAGVLAWLAALGILVLFTLALTWLAVIPGLTAKTVDGASAFSYPLIFLPFVSSAFVPTATMPGPVRWFAENQPVTSIVNSLRNLFAGQPVGSDIWIALAWCVGLLVVAYAVAMVTYRRRISWPGRPPRVPSQKLPKVAQAAEPSAAGATFGSPLGRRGRRGRRSALVGGQQLGERQGLAAAEVGELGPAGEAVGEHDGVRSGGVQSRQQVELGDLHRDVVVAGDHAEVAGETATAGHLDHPGARPGQQVLLGRPAHHRRLVAVRLRHDHVAGQVGHLDIGVAGEELRQREGVPGHLRDPRVVGQQVEGVRAPDREAGRFGAHDRDARGGERVQDVGGRAELADGAVQLAGGDPGQAAAGLPFEQPRRVAGGGQDGSGGGDGIALEGVGERVHPQDDGASTSGS
jgi:ABC-2 type transport system permease protein